MMKYNDGNAVCISSQAGCRMGCAFCASALGGLDASLTAGEMCAQIYEIQRDLKDSKVSNIVVMGSGEPLDNYDNVLRFLSLINSPYGLGIGARHITLSTCGLVPQIHRLTDEGLQLTLAVSLHAPNGHIRRQLMPIAKKYGIDQLLGACAAYSRKTGRRVTYEYALIRGLNDSPACAQELAARLRGAGAAQLCHVNVIPVNDVKEKTWEAPDEAALRGFAAALTARGIRTTVRRSLGSGINAACGQLRHNKILK
jgi:23S rRNA (adenine2503-C2)-methyltransferase